MTSFHLILTWHEWNMNDDDIMVNVVHFICKPCDIMSGIAHCTYMHGAHAQIKNGAPKYLSSLEQHTSQLELREMNCLTFSGTKYPKICKTKNMPNMLFPIPYILMRT